MTRSTNRRIKASFLVALITLGGGASLAAAGPGHGGRHRHTDRCGCAVVEYAGRLTIDGCTTVIRADRGQLAQVARAFRSAGYRACIRDGRVVVDYGRGCRPRVRWSTDRSSAQLCWGRGSLEFSLRRAYAPRRVQLRPYRPVRPVRRTVRWGSCG